MRKLQLLVLLLGLSAASFADMVSVPVTFRNDTNDAIKSSLAQVDGITFGPKWLAPHSSASGFVMKAYPANRVWMTGFGAAYPSYYSWYNLDNPPTDNYHTCQVWAGNPANLHYIEVVYTDSACYVWPN